MRIARVFNNNVVLALTEDAQEVILTGRGIGFGAKTGQQVDPSKVARTFVPEGAAAQFGELIADIAPEYLALADMLLKDASVRLGRAFPSSTVVAIADHISYAVKRIRAGIDMAYPLLLEVPHLYPEEWRVANALVASLNETLSPPLPMQEATPITMHLVNSSFATTDLSATFQMTEVLRQLFDVLASAFGTSFDPTSVHTARFVTHLRYFFIRMHADTQFELDSPGISRALRIENPAAFDVALKLKAILELRLGKPIRESELTYLTIHVARLSAAT